MDRNNRVQPKRLAEPDALTARIDELKERCARLDAKGRGRTVHHEELDRLEQLVSGTTHQEDATDVNSQSTVLAG